MAARKRKWQPEKTREKIRATALANRLQQFVLNEKDNFGKEVVMTTAQVQAAKTLLDRVVGVIRENDNLNITEEKTPAEMFSAIKEKVGEEIANKMFPEIAAKLQNHQSDTVQ